MTAEDNNVLAKIFSHMYSQIFTTSSLIKSLFVAIYNHHVLAKWKSFHLILATLVSLRCDLSHCTAWQRKWQKNTIEFYCWICQRRAILKGIQFAMAYNVTNCKLTTVSFFSLAKCHNTRLSQWATRCSYLARIWRYLSIQHYTPSFLHYHFWPRFSNLTHSYTS